MQHSLKIATKQNTLVVNTIGIKRLKNENKGHKRKQWPQRVDFRVIGWKIAEFESATLVPVVGV